MSAAPDFSAPFIGWKGLLADDAGNLYSPRGDKWPVGKPLIAECHNPQHVPPVKNCGCGVYAVNSFENLRYHGYNWGESQDGKVWVLAEIAMYGDVIPGAIGCRALKAAPQKVYVPGWKLKLGAQIRRLYGVDLGVIDRFTGETVELGRREKQHGDR